MSRTLSVQRSIGRAEGSMPAAAAALITVSTISEVLMSLSRTLPAGGLALVISEVLVILGSLVVSILASQSFGRI